MMPIQQLLHRIQHDAKFAHGEFTLGCFDRIEGRIVPVPLSEVEFVASERMLRFVDADGRLHRIPLHRIREVRKNGQLIWSRPARRNVKIS